jgi:alanine racemase
MLGQTYRVLNEITVSESALCSNYRYFASLNPHAAIAPVLKSNAYGHGLIEVARVVEAKLQAPFICVDSLYEAYELHKQGITSPILIMGYTDPSNYAIWKQLPFSFGVSDIETLKSLSENQPGAKIHLKLDTGMHRLGLQPSDLPDFIKALKQYNNLVVEGIYSHLSQADNPAKATFTNRQISSFKAMTKIFEDEGFSFKWKHIASTSGASFINDPYFNLIRLGLGFYGYTPFGPHTKEGRAGRKNLRPALELTSHLAQIKTVGIGAEVSYGGTYKTKQQETLGILPLGYNEGIQRRLSNLGQFTLSNNKVCEVAGRVCMNMTIIRLSRNHAAQAGDPVTVISRDPTSPASLSRHAQQIGEIEYTVLTGLHPSIRRRIV